jgi:acyl-CoA reductase-like NAD-dependent aldehyde dehydrogenase
MEDIAQKAALARCSFAGQKCNSSKRFIILEKDYDLFLEKFATAMQSLVLGDPMDPATQVPPLSSNKLMKDIDHQVQKSCGDGARLVCGGYIYDEGKNIYMPTVLADVTPEMTCYREEIFGPVASVIKANNIQDAIRLANLNDYALSATVW